MPAAQLTLLHQSELLELDPALQPIEELGNICSEFDTLLLVDAVTSLGCIPLDLDGWGIDAVYSCTQKGLACPPGLSRCSSARAPWTP